jgi:hypothetical protein
MSFEFVFERLLASQVLLCPMDSVVGLRVVKKLWYYDVCLRDFIREKEALTFCFEIMKNRKLTSENTQLNIHVKNT